MRNIVTLASAAALIITSFSPVWSADPIGGAYSHTAKVRASNRGSPPAATKPWVAPRNSFVTVSARYCENTACESVTLGIWRGDSFVMHRLGPHEERIRIANIDAADVVARCPAESAIAQEAKLQLMSILNGSTFVLARVSGEKDHASTAFVTANGKDVGKRMMNNHHARALEQPPQPWC